MARPTTRAELLEATDTQYYKLEKLLDSMSPAEQDAPLTYSDSKKSGAHWERDKNLRDILIHLYEWHQLLLTFVASNQAGQARPFLPSPYNWRTYGDLNLEFWREHQRTSYEEASRLLNESHQNVVRLVEGFTDEELFEKTHFDWTGTATLGSYCASATSSHYDWAMKKIRASLRTSRTGG
ncbi:ClbS/DfsB family four-helix bundle protein [Actinomycetaceae bacterium MB13-C1-2]|nr:ClbS/DfsB family four-helix bundle protein [Actinomycetaceae bacterium MB13-C1-2]